MNTTEKRNQIIAMLYQNMDKVDADETLKLIDELSTMAVKNNAVLPHVSGMLPDCKHKEKITRFGILQCRKCGKPFPGNYH